MNLKIATINLELATLKTFVGHLRGHEGLPSYLKTTLEEYYKGNILEAAQILLDNENS
jgi:hypothetical protein